MTDWAGVSVRINVAEMVDRKAAATGLPRNVLRAFVLAESGGDPDAIGDGGASVGLLQLHERGQGAGMSVAERRDPARNLAVGVPPIARAWRNTAHVPYDRARVERVALTSGHPIENIDTVVVGSDQWEIAMSGAQRIGHWWDMLEREHPSEPEPPPATAAAMVHTITNFNTRIGETGAWAREHPLEAAAAVAAGVLILLVAV